MARYEHLPIYRAAFDLAVHLEKIVRSFSRYHKYTLGTELRDGSRRVLRRIIEANEATQASDRVPTLRVPQAGDREPQGHRPAVPGVGSLRFDSGLPPRRRAGGGDRPTERGLAAQGAEDRQENTTDPSIRGGGARPEPGGLEDRSGVPATPLCVRPARLGLCPTAGMYVQAAVPRKGDRPPVVSALSVSRREKWTDLVVGLPAFSRRTTGRRLPTPTTPRTPGT